MKTRRLTFDGNTKPLTFDNPSTVTFKVDRETRTIKGLALPFGDVGDNGWDRWTFTADTEFRWTKPKFLNGHDWAQILGVLDLEQTEEGLVMSAKVAATRLGDEVLTLAEMGAIDGLSVGLASAIDYELRDGVNHVISCKVDEVSTTPIPAFENAQIRSVAASAAPTKGNTMPCSKCGLLHAAGVVECQTTGPDFSAQLAELDKKVTALGEIKVPVTTGGAQFAVREEPMYRFAGGERAPSGHDFAEDLLAAALRNDGAALDRVKTFATERLAGPAFVSTGNVDELNQPVHRPDMFMGQAPVPTSPLYDFHHRGTLADVTPFFYSKLDRAATTVATANHVEGTDPTLTTLVTATGATVTPSPVSGRVHITREVGDQGGNPQVSALVWAEFERSFKISLETKTAALYAAAAASVASLTTAIAAGASGVVAGQALEAGLLGLNFIPDGSRFEKAFGQVDLYTLLALVENSDGEKRYPIINPSNRSGIAGSKFSFLELAGWRMEPAHSLGATSGAASLSYVSDPNAVHVWNSGLQRLEKLGEKVEGWDVGCFGYFAGIVYDATGLRKISYDPTV